VLLGKMILNLLSGLLVYLSLSIYTSIGIALLAALWFWVFGPDFIYTYNHIGGVFLILSVIYFLFLYIKNSKKRFIYMASFLCFLLSLVKINMGISTLAGFLSLIFLREIQEKTLTPQKKKIILCSGIFTLAAVGSVYSLLIYELPLYYIRQCFPYLRSDHPINVTIFQSCKMLLAAVFHNFQSSLPNLFFGLTVFFCAVKSFLAFRQKNENQNSLAFALTGLIVLSILNLHEFFASGIYYRIFWISPIIIMINFIFIFLGIKNLSRVLQYGICLVLLLVVSVEALQRHQLFQAYKIPSQYLPFETGKVYVTNSPEWLDTVKKTTFFLQNHLKKDEGFFALPYDPLYYFFARKNSPVRELDFFEHIKIGDEQQKKIIHRLEETKTNWIVLSSRSNSPVLGLGTLGRDYGIMLNKYIQDHFELIETFGDWQTPPRKAFEHHGTKIFKRIRPL